MSAAEKVNILIVDDDERKLLTYEAVLAQLGENLIRARSADEGLAILLKEDISMVLLDVSMPGVDGFEFAEMMRQHPRFRETPIIFVSGINVTDLDQLTAYERGAVDYIPVPIKPELLRAKVSVFARLHRTTRRLQKMNRELDLLSNRLLEAQDAERRHIARELHDGLGQELTFAKLVTDTAARSNDLEEMRKRAAEAGEAIDRALQQVRSISYLLYPPLLDESGLGSALKLYVEGLETRGGIKAWVEIDPPNFPRLKPEIETAVFRVVQESLTNVVRHAQAQQAWISLASRDGLLVAAVRDDGKGLANGTDGCGPQKIGVGISGMRQRAKELGGEFEIRNANPGVLVEIRVPVQRRSAADKPLPVPAS
jgi:signal transduction histidine kinase